MGATAFMTPAVVRVGPPEGWDGSAVAAATVEAGTFVDLFAEFVLGTPSGSFVGFLAGP